MLKYSQLNWFGRFMVKVHNTILGPEYDYNDWEMGLIHRWGRK